MMTLYLAMLTFIKLFQIYLLVMLFDAPEVNLHSIGFIFDHDSIAFEIVFLPFSLSLLKNPC